jgi:hypothetical protein
VTLLLLVGTFLDEGTERSKTSTQTGHDDGRSGLGRKLHDRRLDGYSDRRADLEAVEVACGLTESVTALGVDPVDSDDEQGDGVGSYILCGGNRVFAALHRADDADNVVEAWVSRWELKKNVGIGDSINLSAALELSSTFRTKKLQKLTLLALVIGELGK